MTTAATPRGMQAFPLPRGLRALVLACAAAGCTTVAPPTGELPPRLTGADVTTVYAVGDIAQCWGRSVERTAAARTARLVPAGATVIMLGDSAYPYADAATLQHCYEPTWGRHRPATLVVAGNHDFAGGTDQAFREYFAVQSAGGDAFLAYQRDLGAGWRLVVLDSNVDAGALEQQYQWLERELQTLRGAAQLADAEAPAAAEAGDRDDPHAQCLLVAWHAPLFSSGLHRGSGAAMRRYWSLLDRYGADAVLSGHEHFYEAFEPRNADGAAQEEGQGPRAFVVGTGGAVLYGFWRPPYASRARVLEHGVLELSLAPGRYGWRFIDVAGRVRDAGTAQCRTLPMPGEVR